MIMQRAVIKLEPNGGTPLEMAPCASRFWKQKWIQMGVPPRNGSMCEQITEAKMDPNRGTPSKWLHVRADSGSKNGSKQGTPLEMVPYTVWRQQQKQYYMHPDGSGTTDLKG